MLQRLTTWLWYLIVALVLLLAMYSSFGRLLLGNLANYQDDILRELNARVDFTVEIAELRGSWRSLSPRVEARGVRLLGADHTEAGLSFETVTLELDVLDTVRTLSPQLFALSLEGGRIRVDVSADGQLQLAGMPASGQGNLGPALNDFIFNAEELTLGEMVMEMHSPDRQREAIVQAELQRDGDFRRFQLSLQAPDRDSWFRVKAEGRGELSDIRRFEGIFHLQSSLGDLSLYPDLLAQGGLEAGSGVVGSNLWLALDRGEVRLAGTLAGSDIRLKALDEDREAALLEEVAATAAAEFVDGLWRFRARDIAIRGSEEAVAIDRLVGTFGNNSLSLRMGDLRLGELSAYLERAGLLPETAAEVLGRLSPTGHLERVEFSLADLKNLGGWRLATNFSNLDVNPWKGAPGLANAAGYADLNRRGGRVQLASSDFTMAFPPVFHEPLNYASFSAELEWVINEDAFRLRSGPFTGRSEEGEVRGLFALELPRIETPTGAEMDLMVALRDTSPEYRRKYLPYKLSPKLLEWLEPGIGEGLITEGGFIYRGSLVRSPERRTIQLFFDVASMEIDYHPDWPAAYDLEGLVLIDDSDVDIYASHGRILESDVRDIRAQLRTGTDKQLRLHLEASMAGSAADGLSIVNNSPLRDRVGDIFADWVATGELVSRLDLSMNLSDSSQAPQVDLWAEFGDVDVGLGELNLTLQSVDVELQYHSATGFAAEDIRGTLWGEPFTGWVRQGRDGNRLSDLDIGARGAVSVDDLKAWLDLDLLRLASGRSEAELHILVPGEGEARLTARSALEGVSLDLPAPWAKTTGEERAVTLDMPLATANRELALAMEDAAYLNLRLDEQGFRGGALSFAKPPEDVENQRFIIQGQLPLLDWDEWQLFIDTYIATGPEQEEPILTVIDTLDIGEMRLFGQSFQQVRLNARENSERWVFEFSTDWVNGEVDIPDDFSRVSLNLASLDVDGLLAELDADGEEALTGDEPMPVVGINIARLHRSDALWGNVSFDLRQDGPDLHFENLRGNLRQLQLGSEEGMRLDWLQEDGVPRSHLAGTLGFINFGDVLAEYQYEQIVETSSGIVNLDLEWPGRPDQFGLASSSGTVDVDVGEGRFLKTSGAAEGTLRVVGILNLAEFVRRLSLDLSQIYESGVPFDTIKGNMVLREGLIEVPNMDVSGRSSRLQFVGVADVNAARIDGELVATLPIASNLPWMFALVSGLPAAAGVYVISKLFNKQMDRFSSAVYRVEGPWVDPEVNFERIFDNSAKEDVIPTTESVETEEGYDKPGS